MHKAMTKSHITFLAVTLGLLSAFFAATGHAISVVPEPVHNSILAPYCEGCGVVKFEPTGVASNTNGFQFEKTDASGTVTGTADIVITFAQTGHSTTCNNDLPGCTERTCTVNYQQNITAINVTGNAGGVAVGAIDSLYARKGVSKTISQLAANSVQISSSKTPACGVRATLEFYLQPVPAANGTNLMDFADTGNPEDNTYHAAYGLKIRCEICS